MWRPAHGATSRPGPSRPAGGYGRVLGRPGPRSWTDPPPRDETALDPSAFAAVEVEVETETPAPVTP